MSKGGLIGFELRLDQFLELTRPPRKRRRTSRAKNRPLGTREALAMFAAMDEVRKPRGGKARHASADRAVYRDPRNPKGRGFASWVRALKGKSGAYLIRSKTTGEYIYAGESHTGNLSRTLVRHFYESWQRKRGGRNPFNRAEGGEIPGYIYDRNRHVVRVQVTHADRAVALQNEWIAKYDPRDNRVGGEAVPF